jgi:hypothetical protein
MGHTRILKELPAEIAMDHVSTLNDLPVGKQMARAFTPIG